MFGIILNPVSGEGTHRELAVQVGDVLAQRGIVSRLYETACEGDGVHQARCAIEDGCEAVVCIGGDGTLSEVVQALAMSGVTLYIVPGGTGNDFVRALGLPHQPMKALMAQFYGEPVTVDCGSINDRPFINISGSGFDVEVLRKTEELKAIYPGGKAYTKAVLAVLGNYQAFEAEISVDGGAFVPYRSTIIEVANGQYFGGGMRVAPGAKYMDGLLDVVQVNRVPSMLIPFLLPLFKLGIHVNLPIAHVMKAKDVVLRSHGMIVNIDGRLEQMDEAHYRVLPGALTMCLPKR